METVFIVTEANQRVATGHLMECIVCAEELEKAGYRISFWINDDADSGLKKRIPCRFREYHCSVEKDYGLLLKEVLKICPKTILFNLREISEGFLHVFRKKICRKTATICIDEFGHRPLDADIIVNPMIDSYYWDYGESKARLFCGAEYLILPDVLEQYHKKEKKINNRIQKIVVTMGGVDAKNYTVDLIRILMEQLRDVSLHVVVGGGNQCYDAIRMQADKEGETYQNKISIVQNVPHTDLLEMMYRADILFCAGGNTLHEAACVGTPAVIIPSMPHEVRNANAFVNRGFGLAVDTECDLEEEVLKRLDDIKSCRKRSDMSRNGKIISDGMGKKRIMEIIAEAGHEDFVLKG